MNFTNQTWKLNKEIFNKHENNYIESLIISYFIINMVL